MDVPDPALIAARVAAELYQRIDRRMTIREGAARLWDIPTRCGGDHLAHHQRGRFVPPQRLPPAQPTPRPPSAAPTRKNYMFLLSKNPPPDTPPSVSPLPPHLKPLPPHDASPNIPPPKPQTREGNPQPQDGAPAEAAVHHPNPKGAFPFSLEKRTTGEAPSTRVPPPLSLASRRAMGGGGGRPIPWGFSRRR